MITLRPTDGFGNPVTGARIFLEGHMSHAGMTAVGIKTSELEAGRYVGVMELSMAGDWIIIARVIVPDRGEIERQFEIKGVLPS